MTGGVLREDGTLIEHNYVLDKVSKTIPHVIAMMMLIAGMLTRIAKYTLTASLLACYTVLKHTIIVPIVLAMYIMWVSVVLVPSRPFLYLLDVKQPTSLNNIIEMAVHVQFFVTQLTHYFVVAFIFGAIVGVVTGYNLRFVHYILTPSRSSKVSSQLSKVPTHPRHKGSFLTHDVPVEYETSPRKLPRRPVRPIRIRSDSEENFASNLSSIADDSENTSTAKASLLIADEENLTSNAHDDHAQSPVENISRNLEGGMRSLLAQRNSSVMNTASMEKKYLLDQDRLNDFLERKDDLGYLRKRKLKRDLLHSIPSSPIMEEKENKEHKRSTTLKESDQNVSGSNVAAVPVSSISKKNKDEKRLLKQEVSIASETDLESTATKNELFSTLEREGDLNTFNTIASDVLTSETGTVLGGDIDKSSGSIPNEK